LKPTLQAEINQGGESSKLSKSKSISNFVDIS